MFAGTDVYPGSAMAVGDLDRDGNMDLVVGTRDAVAGISLSELRICNGDGGGRFICSNTRERESDETGHPVGTNDIEVVDVNGDDYPDLLLAVESWRNEICLNDGNGFFGCVAIEDEVAGTLAVTSADFDRNGTMDAFFANRGTPNRICLGDGAGGFSCSDASARLDSIQAVDTADMNNDRYPDVVLGGWGGGEEDATSQLCLSDGAGGFDCTDINRDGGATRMLARDFNQDGSQDALFVGNWGGALLCLGDGFGGFFCTDIDPQLTDDRGFVIERFFADGDVWGLRTWAES